MLQMKAEKRIDQYIDLLESRSYITVEGPVFGPWGYGETRETYGESIPSLPYAPIEFPFHYGKPWTNFWFSTTVTLPSLKEELFLLLDTETDTLIFVDGKPFGATNPFHRKLRVTEFSAQTITLHMEAWGGHKFPGYHPSEGGRVLTTTAVRKKAYPLQFSPPSLLVRDEDTYGLYYDVLTLRQLSKTLDSKGFHYQHLVSSLHTALSALALTSGRDEQFLAEVRDVRSRIQPLLQARNGHFAPQILSVGNAHLDHAWLWPIAETTRKAARTCLNMVSFTKEYPSFVFMFSQPAQMEAVKGEYPSVYEKVLEAYRSGSWEPNGVCYVEPDCVLPSAESLIRQCMMGRTLTKALFDGYEGDVFWLPDSFGYTAALPQILVGCGVSYFVTSKLSWNDTNRFPYDLLLWESLDGTRIPTHMIQGAYEGTNDPQEISKAYDSVVHKDLQPILMRPIGEGDGAGGTLRRDLELMKREEDLQGMPKNKWSSLSSAMHEIFRDRDDLPVYRGELYLELHRGTYTSQARLKRWNRKLEGMLHSAEYLSALSFSQGEDVSVLLDTIDQVWKIVLTNQFHDILPGSSIREVNIEAEASYEKAYALLEPILRRKGSLVLNTNGLPFVQEDGSVIAPYTSGTRISPSGKRGHRGTTIRVSWATLALDAFGGIRSLRMLSNNRELVEEGKSFNTLTLTEDYPIFWDAWDIEADSLKKAQRILTIPSQQVSEDSLFWHVTQQFTIGRASSLTQTMVIYKELPKIEFRTEVDWRERHQLLQVSFPTTVRTEHALFDVPLGYISRKTDVNTSLERAKFEVAAHKWAALSDPTLSIALASDCKYGYRVREGELTLSLLRSPAAPDPDADQGEHVFTYALLCSEEGLMPIMGGATQLNNPPIQVDDETEALCRVEGGSVLVETVKVSEDRRALVFRLREYLGTSVQAKVHFSPTLSPASLRLTNMVEQEIEQERLFAFKPFEVKTYALDVNSLLPDNAK
ncbi:MAG: glycoside hydrolase family 38 C-terminal domain-containing protein [Sphaerochaeta sp.]|nr:glycoside hydrolase family 38 C-terminal domain-containing protein [Sphaerochaeta sp.]